MEVKGSVAYGLRAPRRIIATARLFAFVATVRPNPRFVEAMYSADLRGEAMHVEGMATGPPPVYPVATPMLQQQLMQHPQPMQQSQHQLVAQQPSQAGVLAGAPYVPKVNYQASQVDVATLTFWKYRTVCCVSYV